MTAQVPARRTNRAEVFVDAGRVVSHGRAVAARDDPYPLVIFASIAGNIIFQALFLAFPLTCRQWAILFVVSAALLAAILVAIIVVLIPRPEK